MPAAERLAQERTSGHGDAERYARLGDRQPPFTAIVSFGAAADPCDSVTVMGARPRLGSPVPGRAGRPDETGP
jgi:hypothetical protein